MASYFDLGISAVDLKAGTFTRQWGRWIQDLFGLVDSLNTSISAIPGVNNKTIAQLNALGLGAGDANYLARVTDGFNHLVRWTGAVWAWGPGDPGAGWLQHCALTPDTGEWALCDGSATTYLGGIGTATLAATSFTTPNPGSDRFLKTGTYTGTNVAPVAAGMQTVGDSGGTGNMDIFSHGLNNAAQGVDFYVIDAVSTFIHTPQVATQPVPASLAAPLYFRR